MTDDNEVTSGNSRQDELLDSWKGIAAYLERDVRTVQRWEKREGLPVHRHAHDQLATVYAYRSEIDTWRENRSRVLGNDRPVGFRFFSENKKTVVGVAGGVTLLLLVGLVAWMPSDSSPAQGGPDSLAIQLTPPGQEQRALAYQLRRADLRPNNFEHTYRAAYQLFLHGDLARAKTYWSRALDLMTPEDLERRTNTTIRLMWLPAFEALLHADPETALREANSLLKTLGNFERSGYLNVEPTGAFYLTLGKIRLARKWFEETEDVEARRQYFLAAIAYVENNHEAMPEHLKQALKARESLRLTGSVLPWRNVVLLLARGGLLSEAEELFASGRDIAPGPRDVMWEAQVERRRSIQRSVLALSRGNTIEGMRMLEKALSLFGPWDHTASLCFMGSEILAKALREEGNSDKAVQVLKAALEQKSRILLEQTLLTGPLWLRLQAQLAQLYREMGRDEDAREIEDELRRRLALADPDHPILRQLDRTEDLALREPTKN